MGAIDEEWEADLVIMDSLSKANKGYNYILTVIDVLSKFAWVEPIKTKSGENLVQAFEKICKKGRQPVQESSGFPANCDTDEKKARYITDYAVKEGVQLDLNQIVKNPGLRALAKLMLNSFWGKYI